jgi:hypothetical protein
LYLLWKGYGTNQTWWTVDPMNVTNQQYLRNTNNNYSTAAWVTALNPTDPQSHSWLNAYVAFDGCVEAWVSFSRLIINSANQFIGVQSADLNFNFLHALLQAAGDAMIAGGDRGAIYAFELHPSPMEDTVIASSSDPTLYHYDGSSMAASLFHFDGTGTADRLKTVKELAADPTLHPYMAALNSWLLRHYNGSIYNYITNPHPDSVLLDVPGNGVYSMEMREIRSGNLHWALVHFVSKADLLALLTKANSKTIGAVIGVIVAGVVCVVAFTYFLAKALHVITRDLVLLSDFKFKDVLQKDLDKETGMRRPTYSRIAELWQIQRAFHKMVVTFADAVSQNKRFNNDPQRRPVTDMRDSRPESKTRDSNIKAME